MQPAKKQMVLSIFPLLCNNLNIKTTIPTIISSAPIFLFFARPAPYKCI
jgi:hypothetical protein